MSGFSWHADGPQEVLKLTPAGDLLVCGRALDVTLEERAALAVLCRRINPAANPDTPGPGEDPI